MDAQVSMTIERGIHSVDITIQVDGLLLRAKNIQATCASIDGAIDNIERQIKKYKTRINRRLRQRATSWWNRRWQ